MIGHHEKTAARLNVVEDGGLFRGTEGSVWFIHHEDLIMREVLRVPRIQISDGHARWKCLDVMTALHQIDAPGGNRAAPIIFGSGSSNR